MIAQAIRPVDVAEHRACCCRLRAARCSVDHHAVRAAEPADSVRSALWQRCRPFCAVAVKKIQQPQSLREQKYDCAMVLAAVVRKCNAFGARYCTPSGHAGAKYRMVIRCGDLRQRRQRAPKQYRMAARVSTLARSPIIRARSCSRSGTDGPGKDGQASAGIAPDCHGLRWQFSI